jgi:hypothetical protein
MANQINLDRSQRVDITCKRGDTFNLNLELKDDSGAPLVLGVTQDPNGTDYYFYKMEVREADTQNGTGGPGTNGGYVLSIDGVVDPSTGTAPDVVASENPGLVTFTKSHDLMTGTDVPAGIYVYDIQQKITSDANASTVSSVETLLYGIFKIVEDVTVNL